jgi:hypothetical protein
MIYRKKERSGRRGYPLPFMYVLALLLCINAPLHKKKKGAEVCYAGVGRG